MFRAAQVDSMGRIQQRAGTPGGRYDATDAGTLQILR
jgi:hypothetical protein